MSTPKEQYVGVHTLTFYVTDEDDNDIENEDGTTKEFKLKAMRFKPLEYLCENLNVDDVEVIK